MTFGAASGRIGQWKPVQRVYDAGMQDASQAPLDAAQPDPVDAAGEAAADGGRGDALEMDPPSAPAPVTALAFEVSTAPVGLKYKPKNIGAIWIADESGKLVKSLEVWAATRVRYLTAYTKARAGASIDVSARATLPSHRAHQVTWDLTDKSGAQVEPGKYRLHLELTDGDATGQTTAIDFDTSAAAGSSTPPDAACFSGMKLQLK